MTYNCYKVPTSNASWFKAIADIKEADTQISGAYVRQLYRSNKIYASPFIGTMNHESFRKRWGDRFDHLPSSIKEIDIGEPFFDDLKRFYICLLTWEELSPRHFAPIEEIWERSMREGPSYTSYLDDLFAYSFRKEYGIKYIVPEDIITYDVKGYSDIFPARFMPRWEESTTDILDWSLADVEVENSTLQEVMREFKNMIIEAGAIEIIEPDEVARSIKTSTTYINGVKRKGWSLSWDEHTQLNDKYIAYEEQILVYPSGMRDTVILEKGSSNMIRWAEAQLAEIMYKLPESVYSRGRDRVSEFADLFRSLNGIHILRDIKKCGLTVPIPTLLPYIIKILKICHPKIRWDRLNIYLEPHVTLKSGDEIILKRGAGLGMANSLTTLICIAAHRVAIQRWKRGLRYIPRTIAAIGNDDSDVWIDTENEETAESLLIQELDVLTEIGFIVNQKKSYMAYHHHLFENYGADGFETKISLACGMLTSALLERSIRRAKEFARAAYDFCPSRRVGELIELIAQSRPYEFHQNEFAETYSFGGWIPFYMDTKSGHKVESGQNILWTDPERAWYAYRVIKRYEELSTVFTDSPIYEPQDNSCRAFRYSGYTGDPVKGLHVHYTTSLWGRWKTLSEIGSSLGTESFYRRLYNRARKSVERESMSRERLYYLMISEGRMSYITSRSSKKILEGNVAMGSIEKLPLLKPRYPASYYAIYNEVFARLIETRPKLDPSVFEHLGLEQTYPTLITNNDPAGRLYQFDSLEEVIVPFELQEYAPFSLDEAEEIMEGMESLLEEIIPTSKIDFDLIEEMEEVSEEDSTSASFDVEAYYESIGLGGDQEALIKELTQKGKEAFEVRRIKETPVVLEERPNRTLSEWVAWIDARSDDELYDSINDLIEFSSMHRLERSLGKFEYINVLDSNRINDRIRSLKIDSLMEQFEDLYAEELSEVSFEMPGGASSDESYDESSSSDDSDDSSYDKSSSSGDEDDSSYSASGS